MNALAGPFRLPVTPIPHERESLMPFALRTAELNGYASPSALFSLCGMTENQARTVRFPLEGFSQLYGREPSDFSSIVYAIPASRNKKLLQLAKCELPTLYLNILSPKVCPECVLENGYVDAFLDLRYALVCPKHRRHAITTCPACQKPLSWNRRGLLVCRCGHDFSAARGDPVEHEPVVALASLLRSKLYGEPVPESIHATGFPYQAMANISLRTLLGLIERFGIQAAGGRSARRSTLNDDMALRITADALANWPEGLYRFLETAYAAKKCRRKNFSLRQEFDRFFGSMLKSHLPPNEVEFLRAVFVSFGTDYWRRSAIDRRMLRRQGIDEATIGGINEAARTMGVMPSTVRSLVKRGIVTPTRTQEKSMLFDLSKLPRKVIDADVWVKDRSAAFALGIPVSVLKELRACGSYKVHYIGARTTSFHRDDVEGFRRRFVERCSIVDAAPPDSITVAAIMRKKFRDARIKAQVISAILDGTLSALGRIGETIGDVLLPQREASEFTARANSKIAMRLPHQAAKVLGCGSDASALPWLIENGYLDLSTSATKTAQFITEESIERFRDAYAPAVSIAKSHQTSTRKVINICDALGLPVLFADRVAKNSPQPFVRRSDIAAIESALQTKI